MKRYTVHAPEDVEDAGDRAVFIKDGFSWLAFLVPALWILWHRLWTVLVWWIAFALVVAWTGRLLGDNAAAALACLGQLLFALEANNLRRSALERRGWTELGGSFGADRDEAELRFFHTGNDFAGPFTRSNITAAEVRPSPAPAHNPDRTVIGLFPEPQR